MAELLGLEVGQLVGVAGLVVVLVGGGGTAAWIWSCRRARDRQARSQLVANSYHSRFPTSLMGEYREKANPPQVSKKISRDLIFPHF